MNVLLNIKPTDVTRNIHAVKVVLAMNDRGRQYLKHLKTAFPERQYITNINKSNAHYFTNEIKATHIQCNKRATTNRFQQPVTQQYR